MELIKAIKDYIYLKTTKKTTKNNKKTNKKPNKKTNKQTSPLNNTHKIKT